LFHSIKEGMSENIPVMSHFVVIFGCYLVAFFLFCLRLITGHSSLSLIALRWTLISFFGHLFLLSFYFQGKGYPFLSNSFDFLQVMSLTIVLVYLVFSHFYRFYAAGLFLLPLTLVFSSMSLTKIIASTTPGHFFENPWAFIHLLFVSIGIAIFIVSFITGLLFIFQEIRIKKNIFGGFLDRLPSLESLDQIYYKSLYLGFVLFTVGIITGGGWSKSETGHYLQITLKPMLALGIWIFFAIFLNLRKPLGLKGARGILLSAIGFLGAILLASISNGL